jgi:hypothetical protein
MAVWPLTHNHTLAGARALSKPRCSPTSPWSPPQQIPNPKPQTLNPNPNPPDTRCSRTSTWSPTQQHRHPLRSPRGTAPFSASPLRRLLARISSRRYRSYLYFFFRQEGTDHISNFFFSSRRYRSYLHRLDADLLNPAAAISRYRFAVGRVTVLYRFAVGRVVVLYRFAVGRVIVLYRFAVGTVTSLARSPAPR